MSTKWWRRKKTSFMISYLLLPLLLLLDNKDFYFNLGLYIPCVDIKYFNVDLLPFSTWFHRNRIFQLRAKNLNHGLLVKVSGETKLYYLLKIISSLTNSLSTQSRNNQPTHHLHFVVVSEIIGWEYWKSWLTLRRQRSGTTAVVACGAVVFPRVSWLHHSISRGIFHGPRKPARWAGAVHRWWGERRPNLSWATVRPPPGYEDLLGTPSRIYLPCPACRGRGRK